MYYPEDVVEQVIAANDIVDVIGSYVHLKKSGSSYMGLCPFHSEKTPSFSVSPGKQVFHCFGCGEGGNVISFLMKYENYSFQEALKVLADRAGIRLPEENYSARAKAENEQKARILAINKEAATYYYRLLRSPAGHRGLEYFTQRKLSPQTMNSFGLGFADGARSDLTAYLRSRGFRDEEILTAGVAAFDEKRGLHDKFWNRVMFPIMDVNNRVIGFGGRVMGDGKPKYLNSPETPVFDKSRNLYGLNAARRTKCGYFILCEGYMDVIAMHQAGFTQAVASLGTSFTEGQAAVLKRYVKLVLLSYDSDGAGVKAAMRNIGVLHSAGLNGKVVNLEPYKDPDEFIRNLGAEEFQKRLDQAENSFYYQIRQIQKNYQMDDPASRSDFIHEIARKLCEFDDEIERDSYIKGIASRYLIDEGMLRREVASYRTIYDGRDHPVSEGGRSSAARQMRQNGRVEKGSFRSLQAGRKTDGVQSAASGGTGTESDHRDSRQADETALYSERLLLTWISDDPDLYPQIRDYISADDFEEGMYRKAAGKYFSMLEQEIGDKLAVASGNGGRAHASPAMVIALFDSDDEQKQCAELFETRLSGIKTEEEEKALRDTLCRVKQNTIYHISDSMTDAGELSSLVTERQKLQALKTIPLHLKQAS